MAFYQRLLERVRQLPGVQTAGAARALPLGSTIGDFGLRVDGYVPPPGTGAKGDWQIVTDGYLEAIGERVVRGRGITPADTSDAQLVALVNEEMARRYFDGRDPIGGRIRIGGAQNRPWVTVVGIVADVRHNGITDVIKEKFYIPHTQWHRSIGNPIREHVARGQDVGRTRQRSPPRSAAKSATSIRRCRWPTSGRWRSRRGDDVERRGSRDSCWCRSRRWRWYCRRSASTACCRTW